MENNNLTIACSRLKSEMLAEMKLLADFSQHIEAIKADIQQKNWVGLERKLNDLHALSLKVESLENLRQQSFDALRELLQLPREATFKRVARELGYSLRGEFEEVHQKLKIEVYRVKIEYQNLGYYLSNISGFIYKFLEEVFPHTKGKIYSRQGKTRATSPESVMINKKL